MPDSLFIPDGDQYLPTELTRGGWSDRAQHGSPPSGLLAAAVEGVSTVAPMRVARFTVDLFRPVPLEPLRVETHVRRDGKRIQVVEATLRHGDLEVGKATALKIRTTDLTLPDVEQEPWEQPPPPQEATNIADFWPYGADLPRFHRDAIEIRSIDDSFMQPGPGLSWFRLKQPVIAGEEPTPFVRLATLADMSNGNSQALDPEAYVYVNPDITLYAHRLPTGDWVGMKSAAHQHRSGIGLADTRVFDETGPLGRISQAQLLDRRRGG
jgi:hypothetical protein